MGRFWAVVLVLVLGLGLAGCGDDGSTGVSAAELKTRCTVIAETTVDRYVECHALVLGAELSDADAATARKKMARECVSERWDDATASDAEFQKDYNDTRTATCAQICAVVREGCN